MWCQLPALGQQLWLTLAIVRNIPNWSPSVLMALLRKISHSPPPSLGFRSLNWLCWSLLRLATSLRTVCWSASSARRVNAACSLQMSSPDLIFRLDMKPLPLPSMSWDSRHNVYPLPCIAKFLPLWDNSCNFFCEFSSFLSDNFDYSKKSEGNLCLISGKLSKKMCHLGASWTPQSGLLRTNRTNVFYRHNSQGYNFNLKILCWPMLTTMLPCWRTNVRCETERERGDRLSSHISPSPTQHETQERLGTV